MKPVDRYVRDVLHHVFAAPEERQRLEADLRAHFAEAESRGQPPGRIIEEMGAPQEVAAAFNAQCDIRYAGFWQRTVAFLGDCGFVLALILPAVSFGLLLAPDAPTPVAWTILMGLLAIAVCGIVVFYFPVLEARFGKTLGKHLLRIRVIHETGAPISLGQAFVRRLSLYFEMLVVDALFVPFTDKRQRALDIVARTIVAREPDRRAPVWAYAVCLLLPVASLLALAGVAVLCAPA